MENIAPRELILKTLKEKSVVKQDVFKMAINVFGDFRQTVKEVTEDLKKKAAEVDKRLIIEYKDRGEFEFELRVAGDVLIF